MALGYMRRHRRWLYVFLWLVLAAFIILHIPAFQQGAASGPPGEVLASMSGVPITVGQFQRSYTQHLQFYERIYQGRLDQAALRRMRLEQQVIDSLVLERLIGLEAARLGISVSDDTLAQMIA